MAKGIKTAVPIIPDVWQPTYDKYRREFEKLDIGSQTILVGHSCGAGFLVRWLSENKQKIKLLILIAPWLDPKRKTSGTMFDFSVDKNLCDHASHSVIFFSSDDDEEIATSVRLLRQEVPMIEYVEFSQHGHFTENDMRSTAFPELLDEIMNSI